MRPCVLELWIYVFVLNNAKPAYDTSEAIALPYFTLYCCGDFAAEPMRVVGHD